MGYLGTGRRFPGIKDQFARRVGARTRSPATGPTPTCCPSASCARTPRSARTSATRLTPAEQHTELTLWAIARSPLILGANLTLLDAPTLRLLTNREILRIDQTATASRQVCARAISWSGRRTCRKAGMPWRRSTWATTQCLSIALSPIYLCRRASSEIKDVWTGARLKASSRVGATLGPHASVVLMLGTM